MTADQILNDLKNKIYHSIYFLMGEETYYIDQISDYIQANVLTEAEKSFNQTILYGKDSTAATITNAAKRFPMMANQQVVIVKEAQALKDIDNLIYYIEKPLKSTILVLNYKYSKLDKRKKIYKTIMENCVVFESGKLYDNQVPDWITDFLKKKNISIDNQAANLLAEFLGTDLSRIVNELDKLMILLPQGTNKINADHIERNIGISKEYNNFELTKALGQKNVLKANRIIRYMGDNQKTHPMVLTMTILYGYFSKLMAYHFITDKSRNNVASMLGIKPFGVTEYELAAKKYTPAKLAQIISYLKEYDLKSKGIGGSSATEGEMLSELIYKILH